MQAKISIVIIACNAEKNIERTLKCFLKWKHLIVIDNNSTDRTIEISKRYTSRIYQTSIVGLAEVRNFALSKIKTDWVLFIDSDEIINDYNQKLLLTIFGNTNSNYDGYWLARRNYYSNNPKSYLRYGLFYPDYQLRLFKKSYSYVYKIHEIPNILNGKTKHLSNVEIFHYPDTEKYFSIKGLSKFSNFIKIYSKSLNKKNIFYLLYKSIVSFIDLFFISLIRGKGILDGFRGITAAFVFSSQISLIYLNAIYEKLKDN